MKLFPHQLTAASRMFSSDSFLLADEPGLGKTATVAAAAIESYKSRSGVIIVICPRNVIEHWKGTFKELGYTGALAVTNYESLGALEGLMEVGILILDESHKLKNETSARFQEIYRLWQKWSYENSLNMRFLKVYLCTGTPVYSYPIDLLTSLLLMRKLDFDKVPAFKIRYCNPIRRNIGGGRKILDMRGSSNLPELKKLCEPFMLRRTWEDAGIKMPAVTLTDLEVGAKISDPQYLEATKDFKKFYTENGGRPAGAGMARFTVLRKLLAIAKSPAAAEQALDDIKGGQKTIFFSEFRDCVETTARLIEKGGGKALIVMGGKSAKERAETLQDFIQCKEACALVATTDSLGEGTDGLQEACHLVNFIDLDFEPSMFVQALRRVLRIRQKHPVGVRRFFVAGDKMEEFIVENWAKKERILKELGLNSDSSLQSLQRTGA